MYKSLWQSTRTCAFCGNLILITIRTYRTNKKVKSGELYKSIIVRSQRNVIRHSGYYVKSELKAIVILNTRMLPLGTRILGPIMKESRRKGFFLL